MVLDRVSPRVVHWVDGCRVVVMRQHSAPWIGAASIAGGFVMMDQWYYAKKGAKEEPEEEQEE